MLQEAKQFMDLFAGFEHAYGCYQIETQQIQGEKIKGRAATIMRDVTDKLWHDHLSGISGVGIIPINEKSEARFGAIDIDKYPLNHQELVVIIKRLKMPLVVCRSKSGGAHCYLFMTHFVPAKLIITKLREMAAALGYGAAETYPRQGEILAERGDIGQWINMPYYDAMKTQRYGIREDGSAMGIQEFISEALSVRLSPEELSKWRGSQESLPQGPPCLNILTVQGFPEGTRNNGLLNLGIYAKKSDPDKWETLLVDFNQKFMDPPLKPEEVMGVIKSLKKREYNYTCNQQPIQPFCNALKCRGCKFGVGGGVGLPSFGSLTKLCTNPPIWFIDIESGGRLELTTEQLQNPRQFQLRCMEVLNVVPIIPDKKAWDSIIQKLMESISLIEVSEDMSPDGQFMEHVERFCTGRVQAKNPEEILLGRPWLSAEIHYFRISDLVTYLERIRFKYEGLRWICRVLRDRGGKHRFLKLKGKGLNVWTLPEFGFYREKFKVPESSLDVPFE